MSTHNNPPPTGCDYEMWDGSYVLGSLSPAERREFEAHLDGCESCSRSVRDLAGLPGLLGRIGPEIFEQPEPEPVPETLLPRLARGARRQQSRRTWLTAGIAAAAAAAVTLGGAVVLDQPASAPSASHRPTTSITAPAHPMTRVGADSMTANVSLTPVAWGTRLDLTCSYPRSALDYQGGSYALVVHTTDGRRERVATWNGLPGRSMQVSGATAASAADIASVVVTHTDGTPVLRLHL
jgi:anti-sigma-K factor RskA